MTWVVIPPEPTKLTDRLYLGCFIDGERGKALGMEAICNCTDEPYAHGLELGRYLRLDQLDGDYIGAGTIRTFLTWMETQHHAGLITLVHCHAGISRSTSFVILWMLWVDGVPRDADLRTAWSEREDFIKARRPIIEPHWKLKKSILRWYEQYGPT